MARKLSGNLWDLQCTAALMQRENRNVRLNDGGEEEERVPWGKAAPRAAHDETIMMVESSLCSAV